MRRWGVRVLVVWLWEGQRPPHRRIECPRERVLLGGQQLALRHPKAFCGPAAAVAAGGKGAVSARRAALLRMLGFCHRRNGGWAVSVRGGGVSDVPRGTSRKPVSVPLAALTHRLGVWWPCLQKWRLIWPKAARNPLHHRLCCWSQPEITAKATVRAAACVLLSFTGFGAR